MKKILLLLLIFVLVLPLEGQGDSLTTTKITSNHKHQIDLDVYFLGVEASFKKKISLSVFFGVGLGTTMLRSTINPGFELDGFVEIARIRPFLNFQLSKFFHFETGITFAGTFSSSSDDAGYSVGLDTGVFIGTKKLLIGIRPSLLFYKSNDGGNFEKPILTTSLLVIKIPLTRW